MLRALSRSLPFEETTMSRPPTCLSPDTLSSPTLLLVWAAWLQWFPTSLFLLKDIKVLNSLLLFLTPVFLFSFACHTLTSQLDLYPLFRRVCIQSSYKIHITQGTPCSRIMLSGTMSPVKNFWIYQTS